MKTKPVDIKLESEEEIPVDMKEMKEDNVKEMIEEGELLGIVKETKTEDNLLEDVMEIIEDDLLNDVVEMVKKNLLDDMKKSKEESNFLNDVKEIKEEDDLLVDVEEMIDTGNLPCNVKEMIEEDDLLGVAIEVKNEENLLDNEKDVKKERNSLQDKKNLEFLLQTSDCVAPVKNENDTPSGNGEEKEVVDARVAGAWPILEELSYLSDPEYHTSSFPKEINHIQKQDSHPNDIDSGKVKTPLDDDLNNSGPSSCPDMARESTNASMSLEEQEFLCSVCGKVSQTLRLFVEHKKYHQKNKSFKWNICGNDFFTKSALEGHMRFHAFSGQDLFNKSELATKVVGASHPLMKMTVKGKNCEKLIQRSNLKNNMEEAKKREVVACTAPKTASEVTLTLGSRILITRRDEKFICNLCNKPFAKKRSAVVHLRIHTDEKRYKCEVCGRGFYNSSNLKEHTRTHTKEKPFTCSVCQKSFSRKSSVLRHSHIHTGEKPFACNVCNKQFTRSSNLKHHSHIHSDKGPFVCSYCFKGFKHPSSLLRHIPSHTEKALLNPMSAAGNCLRMAI